jgi:hypothetical protein
MNKEKVQEKRRRRKESKNVDCGVGDVVRRVVEYLRWGSANIGEAWWNRTLWTKTSITRKQYKKWLIRLQALQ